MGHPAGQGAARRGDPSLGDGGAVLLEYCPATGCGRVVHVDPLWSRERDVLDPGLPMILTWSARGGQRPRAGLGRFALAGEVSYGRSMPPRTAHPLFRRAAGLAALLAVTVGGGVLDPRRRGRRAGRGARCGDRPAARGRPT